MENTNSSLTTCQRIREAVLYDPCLIPLYCKPPCSKRITHGIMAKMIPFRSSIEIECNNSLSLRKNTVEICWHSDWKKLANKFKLTDYSDDNMSKKGPTEHRISISNYKQLTGLYNTLLEMKKHCLLNPSSGIHIHIDLHPFFDSVEWKLMGYENRKDLRRKMINYFNFSLV